MANESAKLDDIRTLHVRAGDVTRKNPFASCQKVALIAQFRLRTGSGDDARMMTFIVDGIVSCI